MLKIRLHFQRVVDAVVALFEQRLVRLARVVAVVSTTDRFSQPVSHQRTCRHYRSDYASINQVADDAALFRDGHGAGQRQDDVTVFVARHAEQHVEILPQFSS